MNTLILCRRVLLAVALLLVALPITARAADTITKQSFGGPNEIVLTFAAPVSQDSSPARPTSGSTRSRTRISASMWKVSASVTTRRASP